MADKTITITIPEGAERLVKEMVAMAVEKYYKRQLEQSTEIKNFRQKVDAFRKKIGLAEKFKKEEETEGIKEK